MRGEHPNPTILCLCDSNKVGHEGRTCSIRNGTASDWVSNISSLNRSECHEISSSNNNIQDTHRSVTTLRLHYKKKQVFWE